MKEQVYRCVLVDDHHDYSYSAVFSGGGDLVRLECPPHKFGKFELGGLYSLKVVKISNSKIDRPEGS